VGGRESGREWELHLLLHTTFFIIYLQYQLLLRRGALFTLKPVHHYEFVQEVLDIKLNYCVLEIIISINPVSSRGNVISLMLVVYGEARVRS
jgi:hypothetical protein